MNDVAKPIKILVMDDDHESRSALRKKLQTMCCDVIMAENDTEGIRLAAIVQPDLILLDAEINKIGGIVVCERLKKNFVTRMIPVILLVEQEGLDEIIIGLEIGADDYVIKPFSVQELQIRIRKALTVPKNPKRLCDEYCWLERNLATQVADALGSTITLIRGFANPLMKQLSGLEQSVPVAYLEEILHLTNLGRDITDEYQVLFHSKSVFENVNPVDIVEAAIQSLREAIEEKRQRIQIKSPQTENPVVRANNHHLFKAVSHLVSNAHKYTNRGGTISVVIVCINQSVRIEVADTGVGISPYQQDLILDKYPLHQREHALNRKGIGLGLTFVKSVAMQHHGSLGLESQQGQGSRFWIDLPRLSLN